MTKAELLERGAKRAYAFCEANNLPMPKIQIFDADDWAFAACAYWRWNYIAIYPDACAKPAPVFECRNWNWPGSTTDREPYGVIAHEVGHLADYTASARKGEYFGDYSKSLRARCSEKPITSYTPNDAEWFAEVMRLFITNHALLRAIRPQTHALLSERWTPVSGDDWVAELGPDVPPRILRALMNKMPKSAFAEVGS